MNIRVEFTGQVRTVIGQADDRVELSEGATVATLLEQLGRRYEGARPHLIDASRKPQRSLLVAINGTALSSRQAASTVLHEGDAVVLLPPIAGG
jgi:MoaD family protein